jgi:predicted ribosome quality control (RQC) complex YloA/Tae2 family protein
MAATVLDRTIAEQARLSQAKKAADERKRKGEIILQNLKEAKKLTSGVMASNGIHSLCDPRFLEAYHDKRREANEKLEKNVNAKKANVRKKIEGVQRLREKYGHESTHLFVQFSKDECSTYLQYKMQSNKDPGMPKDLQE